MRALPGAVGTPSTKGTEAGRNVRADGPQGAVPGRRWAALGPLTRDTGPRDGGTSCRAVLSGDLKNKSADGETGKALLWTQPSG